MVIPVLTAELQVVAEIDRFNPSFEWYVSIRSIDSIDLFVMLLLDLALRIVIPAGIRVKRLNWGIII